MRKKNQKYRENKYLVQQLLDENIKAILERINNCAPNVCLHCIYTAVYASVIAEKMGYDDEMIQKITAGCLIHDLGKISVTPDILNKQGPLTKEEFKIMQFHPRFGSIQVEEKFGRVVNDIVLMHHEKLDGSGYPNHLEKDDIPEYVQIASVADEFDALTSDRCYKEKLTPEQASAILREEAEAGKLNPKIVKIIGDGWLHARELTVYEDLPDKSKFTNSGDKDESKDAKKQRKETA